ncbi:MAG: S8 family serine peptidase [Verrucomicrobia bacterium]|nr:S8 family serine peptidase [Verrucomicrobiota bacterium]
MEKFFFLGLLISVSLSPVGSLQAQNAPGRVNVLIGFKGGANAEDLAIVRGIGGQVKHVYTIVPAVAASVPEAALRGLAQDARVSVIEEDGLVQAIDHSTTSGDSELNNSWGVKHIGSGAVHAGGNKGASVRVAVIDSGVDYNHPDLSANYSGGYDFVNNDPNPIDDNGHGTHVAGTIGAADNGSGVVGVAPEARIYALKVLDASGSGPWSGIIAALQWCVDNGIQISNNSYGAGSDPGSIVRAAFDNAAAAGVLHVAAAGNSGNAAGKGDNVIYPARYDSVIAVAATDPDNNRASFSSTGAAVELAAPGVNINSTILGGGYGLLSGTSMASPHVAGAAALVLGSGISDANGNGKVNDDIRIKLQSTADDLGATGRDTKFGYGLVDADEAAPRPPVNAPAVAILSPANAALFDSGASVVFSGSGTDVEDGDLTASLVWTSSINGQIGTGGSFTATLNDGVHTITASATDANGNTGSASITITVGTPPPPPTLSVSVSTAKASYVNGETALITVTVTDGSNPVSGAAVHVVVTSANGTKLSGDGTTDSSGVAKFNYRVNAKRDGKGTYAVDATASKSGYGSGSGSTTFQVN